ncbi:achaete-scute 2 [Biomphalaria glabrata]|nr:achaete-scute-like protein 2-like [Biomphalaria glabrata]
MEYGSRVFGETPYFTVYPDAHVDAPATTNIDAAFCHGRRLVLSNKFNNSDRSLDPHSCTLASQKSAELGESYSHQTSGSQTTQDFGLIRTSSCMTLNSSVLKHTPFIQYEDKSCDNYFESMLGVKDTFYFNADIYSLCQCYFHKQQTSLKSISINMSNFDTATCALSDSPNSALASSPGSPPSWSPALEDHVNGAPRRRRHIPHALRTTEFVAKRNDRERRRIRLVNQAFESLRQHIPSTRCDTKASKISILRKAMGYIDELSDLLGHRNSFAQKSRGRRC